MAITPIKSIDDSVHYPAHDPAHDAIHLAGFTLLLRGTHSHRTTNQTGANTYDIGCGLFWHPRDL